MKKSTSVTLSDFTDSIYTLKALTRYNNKFKIISESVAEHSFFVAILVLKMYDEYNFSLETALPMALIHDVPELHLSDVTHDVKKNFPNIKNAITEAELIVMKEKYPQWVSLFESFEAQDSVEALIVKFADNLSCVQYAKAEVLLGNKGYMKDVVKDAGKRVKQLESWNDGTPL